ncbi:Probable transcription termination factor Rho [Mycobacteroides abscessus subsp. massiliense]|uniref:transcription termination factor Rho n=1 Tax=Mycobacteroides abscessus TaxID=36809 RepID=UPI0009A88111|nr:transcription termination factor Rho [Mycobacteroides abscessus]SKL05993.1 Probable transcription termination factor Rho [Mycobacteroides abscessus subsp. massiliense]SKL83820.1 Probable transcription termination factor Rho [Mycobacteroides abscessus subsp. massiliense]SKN30000.1 Probable transcription termination factor Rho [Mycobacteroides abscessus subsp. massiliense]SKO39171.1 Probable transcription termination factor Rho [Mycobacteroides abscessus subsp. massiliense]SKP25274.1 Probable
MTDTDLIATEAAPETPEAPAAASSDRAGKERRGDGLGALSTMVLPELRALASQVGVKGTSGMRKGDLIAAIREHQGALGAPKNNNQAAQSQQPQASSAPAEAPQKESSQKESAEPTQTALDLPAEAPKPVTESTRDSEGKKAENGAAPREGRGERRRNQNQNQPAEGERKQNGSRDNAEGSGRDGGSSGQNSDNQNQDTNQNQGNRGDDGEGRGRRGRRTRERRRGRDRNNNEGGETELREDDVVQPVAGILDVLDNYAFVRTSGYLAGPNDVYVSMNLVRKNGLRRGDAITGAVRVPRDPDAGNQNQRQKFNPLVRLDSVNGGPVEDAKKRPDFTKLTPLYPNQRLRLETTTEKLTTRVIDLIMPIGKGQRALIVSPPKAGKTTIMQNIANAISANNPECHLMVVLVDERPEEVTDMQRSVKGEVIASTFDRPPSDHTQAAELAIERAKRLVEQGKDVVVLLDSITRLGRAYNNASPASGRILSGGVDSTALYPPKRFLGAARNIENGGSLTIIATAMVETGSTGDTVIFEEFKGTGNAELKLDRKIAERRVFPAVDVNPSGTRKDELLMSGDEFAIVHKLRRVLSGLDSHQAIDLLMSQLRKTKNNYEFLVQVSKNTPGAAGAEETQYS